MSIVNKILHYNGALLSKSSFLANTFFNYKSESLRIVYYHIVSKKEYPYYFKNKGIEIEEFKRQVKYLKSKYDIISLNHAIELAKNQQSLKNKLVITFDDGFEENYSIAAPILDDLQCTATFYLIGNCIDNEHLMWRNKLLVIQNNTDENNLLKAVKKVAAEFNLNTKGYKSLLSWSFNYLPMKDKDKIIDKLWRLTMNITVEEFLQQYTPYLNISQIKELSVAGFEFGSHSMTHPDFSKLSYNEFEREITDSVIKIEHVLDKKIHSFTYPFGRRANSNFEKKYLNSQENSIKTLLGTRNKLINKGVNISSWERDNMEFSFQIALSRFYIISSLRNLRK